MTSMTSKKVPFDADPVAYAKANCHYADTAIHVEYHEIDPSKGADADANLGGGLKHHGPARWRALENITQPGNTIQPHKAYSPHKK